MDPVIKDLLTDMLLQVQSINLLMEELLTYERRRGANEEHMAALAEALFPEQDATLTPVTSVPTDWWRDTRGNYLTHDASGDERMLTTQEIEQVTMTPRRAAILRARHG